MLCGTNDIERQTAAVFHITLNPLLGFVLFHPSMEVKKLLCNINRHEDMAKLPSGIRELVEYDKFWTIRAIERRWCSLGAHPDEVKVLEQSRHDVQRLLYPT